MDPKRLNKFENNPEKTSKPPSSTKSSPTISNEKRYRPKYPWAAGACAGIVEILITFPLEYLKTQAQLGATTTTTAAIAGSTTTSSLSHHETARTGTNTIRSHIQNTWNRKGFFGFYKGLTP